MTSSPTEVDAAGLAARARDLEERIGEACARAGRARRDVTLVAVSKEQPEASVAALAALGQVDFGENKVQAFVARRERFPALSWHLIGPVQTNKVKELVKHPPALLHTVDRPALVEALAARLTAAAAPPLDVLVQVNVDAEAQKAGVDVSGLDALVDQVAATPALRLHGLMALPRPGDAASLRRAFARLRALGEAVAARVVDPRRVVLSMGMSDDFSMAIEEGATHVRVGSALFGPRPGA